MQAPAPMGYPYGGPVPMPYMPAVIVKPETVSGIRTYQITLVLDIIFATFAMIIGLSAVLITTSDTAGAFSLAALLGASVCGLVIVFVLNFIVSLMSVLKMHHGADEYGPEHAKNATRGVVFKWLGTGLSTIATVLVVYLLIIGTFALVGGGGVPATTFVPLLVTIFWTAGVTCKGQMYRHMVRALQPPELRFRADLASILIPGLGIVGIGVVGFVTLRLIALLQTQGPFTSTEIAQLTQVLIGGTFLPPGFAIVGYVLFLTVYLRTSDRLSQGLHQVHATMPSWPAYPMPMMAPPPPPAAAPAEFPPPSPSASVSMSSPAPAPTGIECPQCQQPVAPEAVFCMNCGARVKM